MVGHNKWFSISYEFNFHQFQQISIKFSLLSGGGGGGLSQVPIFMSSQFPSHGLICGTYLPTGQSYMEVHFSSALIHSFVYPPAIVHVFVFLVLEWGVQTHAIGHEV
jgi:hypothetical protein